MRQSNIRFRPLALWALTAAAIGSATGPSTAAAQVAPSPAPPAPPTCRAELDWAADYAARNYSGFETKTAGDQAAAYAELLDNLRADVGAVSTVAECDAILARWTAFFRDGHLSIHRVTAAPGAGVDAAPMTDDAIRERFAHRPRRDLTEAEARRRLDTLGPARSPIEGIWESADGAYRGVVLRDDDPEGPYIMSILAADSVWWVPGQVKAIFQPDVDGTYGVRFFMRDHSENAWTGQVRGDALVLNRRSLWLRDWPVTADALASEAYLRSFNLSFAATDIGPGTVLVQVPSFENTAAIDSLFEAEGERIAAADRLVIDVRGNGGGSDYNYRHLVPLIYTDPIRIISSEALATKDNIRVNERLAADPGLAEGIRAGIASSVEQMKTAEGGWYPFPDRTHEEPTVLERPRQVAILVDDRCASSCEQFLLAARQSRKVTIYGQPTAGILDFGNVRSASMPNGTLVLNHPTTRTKRLPDQPVDGVGIIPDVEIPPHEPDPIARILRGR